MVRCTVKCFKSVRQFWHHSLEAKHLVHDPVNRSWELCIEGGIRGEHGSVHVELQPGAILWLPRGIAHQTSRCGSMAVKTAKSLRFLGSFGSTCLNLFD